MDDRDFLTYLRLMSCALYGHIATEVCADEWQAALAWARQQRTEGLLYEAATRADAVSRPPRKWLLDLYAYVVRVEQVNTAMSALIAELFSIYEDLGASPVLLKGHGVAMNYAHPMWRTPGDIDVFLPEGFDAADRWARTNATDVADYDPLTDKHVEFHWKGYRVENHFRLSMFYHPRLNRRLQAAFAEGLDSEPLLHATFGTKTVDMLPPTVGLLHLLTHFANHIVSEGIGLRQLCDIFMYFHRRHDEIDGARLDRWIDTLRLRHLTDAIATVAVCHFHAPGEDIPYCWNEDKRRAGALLHLVRESGNYGQNFEVSSLERRHFRLHKLRLLLTRSAKVNLLLPDELRAAWMGKAHNACRFGLRALRRKLGLR